MANSAFPRMVIVISTSWIGTSGFLFVIFNYRFFDGIFETFFSAYASKFVRDVVPKLWSFYIKAVCTCTCFEIGNSKIDRGSYTSREDLGPHGRVLGPKEGS